MPSQAKLDKAHELRIKLRRRPADVQLKDIAAKIGVSESWIKSFHAGKFANPRQLYLDRLACYFNGWKVDA